MATLASSHGRRIALGGIALFAISLVNGFLIHLLPLQRPTLSAHLIGLLGSSFLIALSSLWSRLALSPIASGLGIALAFYGFFGGWFFNFVGALTGHFGVYPISAQPTGGHTLADYVVSAGLLSVAVSLFALSGLVLRRLSKVGQKFERVFDQPRLHKRLADQATADRARRSPPMSSSR